MNEKISVLLCTYNGEKYLREQLESLISQADCCTCIVAHDDGSSDNSVKILNEYGIRVSGDEHLGAARGFFYLLENSPGTDFYAFCDQDDVWDKDKLRSGMAAIEGCDGPAIYSCSSRIIDEKGDFVMYHSHNNSRSLSSRLFYASIAGNTMVFNKSLKDIALKHIPNRLIMHDSWLVKLCIAVGGTLILDEMPHIDYRIHGSNSVGVEMSLTQKMKKFVTVIGKDGQGQEFTDICDAYKDIVLPEYMQLAQETAASREKSSLRRGFVKRNGIDFAGRAFNSAFAIKVLRGNI